MTATETPLDVRAIISLWPSAEAFAADLGTKYRSYGRVMKVRRRIPQKYWPKVISAAIERGIAGISEDTLRRAHATSAPSHPVSPFHRHGSGPPFS